MVEPIALVSGDEWGPIIDECGGMRTRMLEAHFDGDRLDVRDRSDQRDLLLQPAAVRAAAIGEQPERVQWVPRADERGYVVLVSHGEFGDWLHLVGPDGHVQDTQRNLHASYLSQFDDRASGTAVLLGPTLNDAQLTVIKEAPVGKLQTVVSRLVAGWPMALLPSRGVPGVWVLTARGVYFVTPQGDVSSEHVFTRQLWGPTTLRSNADGTRLAVGTPFRLITLRVEGDRVQEEAWWHPASCRVLDQRCRCQS